MPGARSTPLIHGDRGWFSGLDGELPRLAWYRAPRHRGPPARWPQAPEGDVAVARRARTPGQTDRWVRLVMAAAAQLLLARPLAADLRRPRERRPGPDRPLPPGRVRRGFPNIWPCLGIPACVAKPTRPGPGQAQGLPLAARHPATRWLRKPATRTKRQRTWWVVAANLSQQVQVKWMLVRAHRSSHAEATNATARQSSPPISLRRHRIE